MVKYLSYTLRRAKTFNLTGSLPFERNELDPADSYCCFALCLFSAISYALLIMLSDGAAAQKSIGGIWFQSDGWRVFDDMTIFEASHFRDNVHPLFSITFIPVTAGLRSLFGISSISSVYVINGILCSSTIGMLFIVARRLDCSRIDAILLCFLFLVSASSIFWFTVPETYPAGCAAIVLCFYVLVNNPRSDRYLVIAAALALGTTVTNWMVGLATALASRPLLSALRIAILSFSLVAVGAVAAHAVFPIPGTPFFLPAAAIGESAYMGHPDSGSLFDRLGGQLLTPIVAPDYKLLFNQPTGVMNSFQSTIPGTILKGDITYIVSIVCLLYLLLSATYHALKSLDRFSVSVMLALAGQMLLHVVYGEETFLYALHFAPLIVMLLAHNFRSKPNVRSRVVLGILIALGLWNNINEFAAIAYTPFRGTEEYLYRLSI